jgi:hypothetical protein
MSAINIEFEVELLHEVCMATGHCEVSFHGYEEWFVSEIWRKDFDLIPAKFLRVDHSKWPCAYAVPRDGYQQVSPAVYGPERTVTLPSSDPQFRIIADAIESQMAETIREKIAEDFPEMDPRSEYEEHAIGVHNAL